MFVISWRNPDSRHASWNLDTYVRAVLDALDAVEEITGSARTVLGGVCSGGILASLTAAYLAGIGRQDRLAALCLAMTVIDNHEAGTISALVDERLAGRAKAKSARSGYLDGRALAEVFAWLRPGDLVWNYWVNNYLLGKRPPAFDILFWNSDTTRMTAGLHADFIDLALQNSLTRPEALTVLGVPIDLGKITVDSYVVAGIADHITPWESCYRSAQLFGGTTRFVLSTSGHIAALVNPPGNPKASFHTGDDMTSDAEVWLKGSDPQQGTWWTDLGPWLDERGGGHASGARRARVAPPERARRGTRYLRLRQLKRLRQPNGRPPCSTPPLTASAVPAAPTSSGSPTSSPRRSATTGTAPGTSSTTRCCRSSTTTGSAPSSPVTWSENLAASGSSVTASTATAARR